MMLSLIGMSNVGKSYWSKRLEAEHGFARFSCDELITQQLAERFPEDALPNMDAFSSWLGMPYDEGYQDRQAIALHEEYAATRTCLECAMEHTHVVIDTTGSLVYLSPEILVDLKQKTTVVYLDAGEAQLNQMLNLFFQKPKPLIWGQIGNREFQTETDHILTLRRLYPTLLSWRRTRYEALADVTIPYEVSHDPDVDLYALLLNEQS